MTLVVINSKSLNNIKKIFKNKNKIKRRIFLKNDITKYNINFSNFFSKNLFTFSFSRKFSFFFFKNLDNNTMLFDNNFCLFKGSKFTLERSYVYLFYKNYFFWFPIMLPNTGLIHVNKNFSSIVFSNFFYFLIDHSIFTILKNWFKLILRSVYGYVFLKFRYKGKNYRWHRKKRGLVIRFGHSHLISVKKPISVFLKKKGRMKMIFFSTNAYLLKNFLKKLTLWKPLNVYTARGLRVSRQLVLRKSGKVSAYR